MKNDLPQFFLYIMGIIVIALIPIIFYLIHIIMEYK